MEASGTVRRTDWLRELHGLLLGGVVVSGVLGIAGVAAALTGQSVEVGIPGDSRLRVDGLSAGTIDPNAGVQVVLADPTPAQVALATVATLPTYLLTTIMLVLLWRLVGAARRTDPFTETTARRLRGLGWLLVVGGAVASTVEFVARFALSDTVGANGASATLDLGPLAVWLLAGVGMLAVGEVVRRGQALRADLDGVV